MKQHVLLLVSFAWALLTGCFTSEDDKTAGAQDFPNTIQTLTCLAQRALDGSSEWQQVDKMEQDPQIEDVDSALQQSNPWLGKVSAEPLFMDTTIWDFSDTADGLAIAYRERRFGVIHTLDTLDVLWDSKAVDTIKDNEIILTARTLVVFEDTDLRLIVKVEDSDTNGIPDLRRNEIIFPPQNGMRKHHITLDGPGPDGAFNKRADNESYFIQYLITSGVDTLSNEWQSDADNDSIVLGGAKADSNIFDSYKYVSGQLAEPGVAFSTVFKRQVFFAANWGKNYSIRFDLRQVRESGEKISFSIHGPGPDSVFYPGDTVSANLNIEVPEPDSVSLFWLKFVIGLSPNPNNILLTSVLGFEGGFKLRQGPYYEVSVAYTPTIPIRFGGKADDGRIVLIAAPQSGGMDKLDLQVSKEGLDGEFTASTGEKYSITWLKGGQLQAFPVN